MTNECLVSSFDALPQGSMALGILRACIISQVTDITYFSVSLGLPFSFKLRVYHFDFLKSHNANLQFWKQLSFSARTKIDRLWRTKVHLDCMSMSNDVIIKERSKIKPLKQNPTTSSETYYSVSIMKLFMNVSYGDDELRVTKFSIETGPLTIRKSAVTDEFIHRLLFKCITK